MGKEKFIEFKDELDQEIIIEDNVKKISFDKVEYKATQNTETYILKARLFFSNENSYVFPMTITVDKEGYYDGNAAYRAAYSFEISHVKKLIVSSDILLPMKLYYSFDKN